MTKTGFISKIAEIAKAEISAANVHLFPSVLIAQACLESGFGVSEKMMKASAPFGIKATPSWTGAVYDSKTNEVYSGVSQTVNASFRAYPSLTEAVRDYIRLLTQTDRYAPVQKAIDPVTQIELIKGCGYATDPKYVSKIVKIINDYNLTLFDTESEKAATPITVDEVVRLVINGNFGNGEDRKRRLTTAGYDPQTIQIRVNDYYAIADRIIKGEFGNGATRKERLKAIGYDPLIAQQIVNAKLK